jgi:histidinol dehydrogenase
LNEDRRRELFNRSVSSDPQIVTAVSAIIRRVRDEGDAALFGYSRSLDGVNLNRLEVPRATLDSAPDLISPQLRAAILRSARNIERVHSAFGPRLTRIESERGVIVTRRPDPLEKVGIYAPGGKAAYASSVLMASVPARVAGVREIVLCSPPTCDGLPSREVLAAASIAGVERVFALGGAGAIAAMAIGTESVPRMDKVVGPGNAFVAEAKLQLAREIAIDCPAGPSELLIVVDGSACPEAIAREVLAQAEHDARAVVLVIAIGETVAANVQSSIASQIQSQPRRAIIEQALESRGGVLVAESIEEAVDVSNAFAPEHLLIATRDAERVLNRVRCAGTVFIGESTSVVFGDYITGANHVLPTGGMARAYSGLSTLDFVRWTTIQRVSPAAASRLACDTAVFAEAEELPGHAAAARSWSAA